MIRRFTLIEVLVALSVLTLGILGATELLVSAQNRCRRSQQQWEEQHAMSQAADFYLLAKPEEPLPDHVFPYRSYRVTAEYADPGETLPDGVSDRNGNWRFTILRLKLCDDSGKLLRTLDINRIVEGNRP